MKNNNEIVFSVIIPVYNTASYVGEAIDSVLSQTFNQKNIEIILVNDGSTDNSSEICKEYKEKFPDQIIFIDQENKGVSAARNAGLKIARGKYINFFDSDDKWSSDAFKTALDYFKKNPDLSVISFRMKCFERSNSYNVYDFKYKSTVVTDIYSDYDFPQYHVTNSFIRRDHIADITFDESISFSEDYIFITSVLLEKKGKIAYIKTPIFFYRKRNTKGSLIDDSSTTPAVYIKQFEIVYPCIIKKSIEKKGYILPYVYSTIFHNLKYRIFSTIQDNVLEPNKGKALFHLEHLLKDCPDYIIASLNNLDSIEKIKLLSEKNTSDIFNDLYYRKHKLYYNNLEIENLTRGNQVRIEALNIINDKIIISGLIHSSIPDTRLKWFVLINDNRQELLLKESQLFKKTFFNEAFYFDRGFDLEIPIKNLNSICFENEFDNMVTSTFGCTFALNSKLDAGVPLYLIYKNKLITYKDKKILCINASRKNKSIYQKKLTKYLRSKKENKALIYRTAAKIQKIFKKKEIWIFADRSYAANDNAFALFKYCKEHAKSKKIKYYFAIDKKSPDYKKVKKYGKAINLSSIRYRTLFLNADKIISSQADAWICNPFANENIYYRDLYTADFCFLQHGVIIHDLSIWLNHYEKNFSLFVTSAKDEFKSIDNNPAYGFRPGVVQLLGLPRHDLLDNKAENLIAIMPTWRQTLAKPNDPLLGTRAYTSDFNKSEYFHFYNKLINDQRLLDVMNEYKVKGIFILHPSHNANIKDFSGNEIFTINQGVADYSDIFNRAKLVVTDYSSSSMDFSYLMKPVIYTQFDKSIFYDGQKTYTSGYFDFERDGFGPVTYNYEDSVNAIINSIKSNFLLEETYKKRIENFFAFRDKNNCKRVYDAIKNLNKSDS